MPAYLIWLYALGGVMEGTGLIMALASLWPRHFRARGPGVGLMATGFFIQLFAFLLSYVFNP